MLRRVWVLWAAAACGVLAGCGGGGEGTGGSGTTSATSTTSTTSSTTTVGPACGDGKVDPDETCDDGNTSAGDGCAADCTIETGFTCSSSPSACVTTCGDGVIAGAEVCDDGNTTPGDGCALDCKAVDDGYTCTGAPSACVTTCGDGVLAGTEVCDDGNTDKDDGCSDVCAVEDGFTCDTASPTICAAICGDGKVVGTEACDDNNTTDGDGCVKDCTKVEDGFTCTGAPSACVTTCGDNIIAGAETCDDGNALDSDGCDALCATETGWDCVGEPSKCTEVCGDNTIVGVEVCDDGNTADGDGCSATCAAVESGWTCVGAPSVCVTTCGDGIIAGLEICDDSNGVSGDGCAAGCTAIEPGFKCTGMPSVCVTTCGDGVIAGLENCDDGNAADGDGCSALCKTAPGYVCSGTPSVCNTVCGDGIVAGTEVCDDFNTLNGDGCTANCGQVELGYACSGSPSVCNTTCGDGYPAGTEACDDGNQVDGDGCSATCTAETGYACSGAPSVCGAVCGDGMKLAGEKCDDGNTTDGDCCSSTCQLETGCEIEPNDTIATANDFAALSAGNKVKGVVVPTADKDIFKVTIPSGGTGNLRAETLAVPSGPTCASNQLDSRLTIFDAAGTSLVVDDDSGDGFCSLITLSGLVPGDYFVQVNRSTAGAATWPYLLQVDVTLSICGNGAKELGEQCDDGGTANGDGCSSLCKLEATPETEPNNTCGASANGPFILPPDKLVSGSISPIGETDWFAFTLTTYADLRLETFDPTGPGACVSTTDTKMQIFNSSCVALGALDDDSGLGYCSLLDPTLASQSFMRHLAPGTYYVQVNPYSATTASFGYTLLATLVATCGNGVKEGSEQCDSTPGCAPDCNLIPVCGDGIKSTGEECDDGNTISGDFCSSTCQVEATPEIEPNGTAAEADIAMSVITTSTTLKGGISSATDKDIFRFSVATQQVVRLEAFDATGKDCVGMSGMTLALLGNTGTSLKTDTTSGISSCPVLVVNLAPGAYYAQMSASAVIPLYVLQIAFSADNGVEAEPNDAQATATAEAGTEFFVCADHQLGSDLDTYAITVPAGKSVRAEVVEVAATATGYETCESLGIDSLLALYSPTFTQLASDDDSGRGYCSAIDGTGVSPASTGAHNLAAGTYYVQVKQSTIASATGAVFNYCLAVTIR